jgi:hypothetical protein
MPRNIVGAVPCRVVKCKKKSHITCCFKIEESFHIKGKLPSTRPDPGKDESNLDDLSIKRAHVHCSQWSQMTSTNVAAWMLPLLKTVIPKAKCTKQTRIFATDGRERQWIMQRHDWHFYLFTLLYALTYEVWSFLHIVKLHIQTNALPANWSEGYVPNWISPGLNIRFSLNYFLLLGISIAFQLRHFLHAPQEQRQPPVQLSEAESREFYSWHLTLWPQPVQQRNWEDLPHKPTEGDPLGSWQLHHIWVSGGNQQPVNTPNEHKLMSLCPYNAYSTIVHTDQWIWTPDKHRFCQLKDSESQNAGLTIEPWTPTACQGCSSETQNCDLICQSNLQPIFSLIFSLSTVYKSKEPARISRTGYHFQFSLATPNTMNLL